MPVNKEIERAWRDGWNMCAYSDRIRTDTEDWEQSDTKRRWESTYQEDQQVVRELIDLTCRYWENCQCTCDTSVGHICEACHFPGLAKRAKRELARAAIAKATGEGRGEGVMSKPNCYKCKHRGVVPHSAHSSCCHPNLGTEKYRIQAFAEFVSTGQLPMGITASQRGIDGGWFNFPLDFDPVWLETCDGFEPK